MVASIAVAFVGAYRLAAGPLRTQPRTQPRPSPAGLSQPGWSRLTGYSAGVLYAASPFLLTRLGIGHLMIVVPMAVLPWVLPTLLRPGDDVRRTLLAAFALSFAGHYGGLITLIIVTVGLFSTGGRRLVKVLFVTGLAQVPWLLPGLFVYLEGASIVDATSFRTDIEGVEGVGQLLAGHGFWQPFYQVGFPGGWPVAFVGMILGALAVYGAGDLGGDRAPGLRAPMAVLAVVGLLGALASATPGLDDIYASMSRNPVGSIVREGHRLLPLYLVWMAPAAALGAHRLARTILADTVLGRTRITRSAPPRWQGGAADLDPCSGVGDTTESVRWRGGATGADARIDSQETSPLDRRRGGLAAMVVITPLVAALLLAAPGLWGINPSLRPVDLAPEYAAARAEIESRPGTVATLPWHQYFDLTLDGRARRVLNPFPLYLGGDVLASSNPELEAGGTRERVDPREAPMSRILVAARQGQPVSADLARLGVRWVVLAHEADWLSYAAAFNDPGLVRVVHGPALDLFAVSGWGGLVVAADGSPVASDPALEPVLGLDQSGAATYNRPAATGWMRGMTPTGVTPEGLVALPAGHGWVWFWPSILVVGASVFAYGAVLIAAAGLLRDRRFRRRYQARTPVYHPTDLA